MQQKSNQAQQTYNYVLFRFNIISAMRVNGVNSVS